ncbi:hypothetical protein Pcinc_011637 [Petrolisthes cinctipes]|uniref:Uncharacterized protein n=1 Tax=Petrolisthes cinctipes TaxID=88211 RepID=A0AAE1G2Q2_PETCI|nr:hypothetical protein Pcinc_011637 [Petrolisthes cinctipes]
MNPNTSRLKGFDTEEDDLVKIVHETAVQPVRRPAALDLLHLHKDSLCAWLTASDGRVQEICSSTLEPQGVSQEWYHSVG